MGQGSNKYQTVTVIVTMAIHSNFYFSTLLLTWQKDAEETRHVMPLFNPDVFREGETGWSIEVR